MKNIFRKTKSFGKFIGIYLLIISICILEFFILFNFWNSLVFQRQKNFYEICLKFYRDLFALINFEEKFDLILDKLDSFEFSLFFNKANEIINLFSKLFLNHFIFFSFIIPIAIYEIHKMPKLFFNENNKDQDKKIGILKGVIYFFLTNIIFSALFTLIETICNKFNYDKIYTDGIIIFTSILFLMRKIHLIDFIIKDFQQTICIANHKNFNDDIKKEYQDEIKPVIGPLSDFILILKDKNLEVNY